MGVQRLFRQPLFRLIRICEYTHPFSPVNRHGSVKPPILSVLGKDNGPLHAALDVFLSYKLGYFQEFKNGELEIDFCKILQNSLAVVLFV